MVTDRVGSVLGAPPGTINPPPAQSYLPYGDGPATTGTLTTGKTSFATYWADTNTGLSYADQRYYNSQFGRFMSADPSVNNVGVANPGSWNRYSYTRNDPVNRVDPRGLADWEVTVSEDEDERCDNTKVGCPGNSAGGSQGGGGGSRDEGRGGGGKGEYTGNGQVDCNKVASNTIPLSGSGRIGGAIGIGSGLFSQIEAQYEYLTAFVDVVKLFGSFVVGSGGTQSFDATSAESNALLSSPLLGNAVAAYLAGNNPNAPGVTYFGVGGLISSGTNPTQQFVGSFSTTIQRQANGSLDITLSNTTGLSSLTNGLLGDNTSGGLFSNISQKFKIVIPCP